MFNYLKLSWDQLYIYDIWQPWKIVKTCAIPIILIFDENKIHVAAIGGHFGYQIEKILLYM